MSTIAPTVTPIYGQQGGVVGYTFKWALGNADSGQAVNLVEFPDKSVEIVGTWGGATGVLEGSNDDDGSGAAGTYTTLNDPSSNALSFTANAQKQVTEVTAWTRPRTSGGTGTAVVASLTVRRAYR
jgi:hypothetical protein